MKEITKNIACWLKIRFLRVIEVDAWQGEIETGDCMRLGRETMYQGECKYFKLLVKMLAITKEQIRRRLGRINVPYDNKIIEQVHSFISKFIGPLSSEDAQYNVPAACAIICQTIQIPTIDNTSKARVGVNIENVMRHIESLSKQKFLETIVTQLKKSDISAKDKDRESYLIEKVHKTMIYFRVFKKYKIMFEKLAKDVNLNPNVINQLLALFWMIYLVAKSGGKCEQDINQSSKILAVLIEEIFTRYYGRKDRQEIRSFIRLRDNFGQLPAINQKQAQKIRDDLYRLFLDCMQPRDPSATPDSNNLLTNEILLSRLVDDLSSRYQRLFYELPEGRFIDEMTFLELTRNLTPQAFTKKIEAEPISKLISFGDDSDEENDQSQTIDRKPTFFQIGSSEKLQPVSLVRCFSEPMINQTKLVSFKSMTDMTPVSTGITKSLWAQGYISSFKDNQMECMLRSYLESQDIVFEILVMQAREKITSCVESLTRHINKKQKAIDQTLTICLSLCTESIQQKQPCAFATERTFNCFLSLSSYLYNLTVRNLPLDLRKYCGAYNADLVECLKVIYVVSEYQTMPQMIKEILSLLQKEVLISQLWDSSRGYELLLEGKTSQNQMIFNRLSHRIYDRIKEICLANKIEIEEVKKIEALINDILKKKTQIFYNSKLDQIIICSICACLNLNQAKYNLALSAIFSQYNTLSLSRHSNMQLPSTMEQEGSPRTLLQFYNKVFIEEVKDMMNNEENPKYLYTPIRERHLQKIKAEGMPAASRFHMARGLSSTNSLSSSLQIQKSIAERIRSSLDTPSSENNMEQENSSPYFGTLSRRGSLSNMDFPSFTRKITFGEGASRVSSEPKDADGEEEKAEGKSLTQSLGQPKKNAGQGPASGRN